jgi:hypothetical protein
MIFVCICAQHTTNKITYVHQNKWKHKENLNLQYGRLVMKSIETPYPNLIQGPHCILKKVGPEWTNSNQRTIWKVCAPHGWTRNIFPIGSQVSRCMAQKTPLCKGGPGRENSSVIPTYCPKFILTGFTGLTMWRPVSTQLGFIHKFVINGLQMTNALSLWPTLTGWGLPISQLQKSTQPDDIQPLLTLTHNSKLEICYTCTHADF